MFRIEKGGSIPIAAACFDNRYDVLIIIKKLGFHKSPESCLVILYLLVEME